MEKAEKDIWGENRNFDENFTEKICTFESDGIKLEGTLTLPKNVKLPPVALLLQGSGPVDRDENVKGSFRKFISNNLKTIAHNLACHGFASFRYDKRGVGNTKEFAKHVGFNDIVQDAKAAIEFLTNIESIDSRNLFVLGHSEGGAVGTILSAENKNIKGFIGIASPITPFDKAVVEQIRHIFKVRGKSEEKVEKLTQAFTGVFNLMREHRNWEQIDPNEVKNIFSKVSIAFKILPAKTVKKAIAKQFRPEWFIESFDYDFHAVASKITCPVLLIFGEKDFQVPFGEGEEFERLLRESGNKDVQLTILLNLNHMLRYNPGIMDPKTSIKSVKDEFDKRVLETITAWLDRYKCTVEKVIEIRGEF